MNYIFLFSTLLMLLMAYLLSNKNVFSPSVIMCAVFSLSALFVILNENKWDYFISPIAYEYLIIALLISLIGTYYGERVKINFLSHPIIGQKRTRSLDSKDGIQLLWMNIFSLICMYVIFKYFQRQYTTSLSLGNVSGISGMLPTLRKNVYDVETFSVGTLLNIGISFMRAIGFISLFMLIKDLVLQKKITWRYIVPVMTVIVYIILSTGRGGFISFFCAGLYDLYYSFQLKGKTLNSRKMLVYMLIGFLGFIILFWQLGKVIVGKDKVLDFWDTISIYIGSSILCFDSFVNTPMTYNFIGSSSLRGIHNILYRFGLENTMASNHADKIRWNGYMSNVYTSFMPYYADFGPFLSLVIVLAVCFLIGHMWRRFQNNNNNVIIGVIYGRFIAYSVAMYSIAERLLSTILALNAIVEIVFIVIVVRLFVDWDGSINIVR